LVYYVQSLIGPVITTLLFLTIFTLAFGDRAEVWGLPFVVFVAPGLIMMSVLQNAFMSPSASIILGKLQGNIVDTVMAPLSSLDLALGYGLSGVARGLIIGYTTLLCVAVFVDLPYHSHFLIFLALFNGGLMMSLLGTLTGIWGDKFDNQATISNFVVNPLAFLSGTFYSIDRLPETWQTISHFNPFFYVIDAFRYGFLGISDADPYMGMMIVGILNVVLLAWTYALFASGYKLKT